MAYRHSEEFRREAVLIAQTSGLRAWRGRPISRRQLDDLVLLAHITEQHRLSLGS